MGKRDEEEQLEGQIIAEERELKEIERLEDEVDERLERHRHELRQLRERNEYHLEVIVNGTPTIVRTSPEARLESIVAQALDQTENTGQPVDRWVLRDAANDILNTSQSPKSYGFASGTTLYLSLNAGVGGNRGLAQYVDPTVSQSLFNIEIAEYRQSADDYRRRGWFLISADFPKVIVAMAAPHLTPSPLVLGVEIDYTNYDVEPPSLKLINPFTSAPYMNGQMPLQVLNFRKDLPGTPELAARGFNFGVENLVAAKPDGSLFLCVAGLLEYHRHPAHTGDPWELHRPSGAGKLIRLLDIIYNGGVKLLTLQIVQTLALVPAIPPTIAAA